MYEELKRRCKEQIEELSSMLDDSSGDSKFRYQFQPAIENEIAGIKYVLGEIDKLERESCSKGKKCPKCDTETMQYLRGKEQYVCIVCQELVPRSAYGNY